MGYERAKKEYDISRNGTPTPEIGVFEYSKDCAQPQASQNTQPDPTILSRQWLLGAESTIPGGRYEQQSVGNETSDPRANLKEPPTGLGIHWSHPLGSAQVVQPSLPRLKDSPSSSTTLSGVSTPGTENHIDERKSRIVDGVVLHVANKIKAVFALARGVQSETSAPSVPNESSKSSTGTTSTTGSDQRRAKKMRFADGNNGDTDDDDEDPAPPKEPEEAKKDDQGLAYACPCFKYNPGMYRTARNCPGPGWPSVHRVK